MAIPSFQTIMLPLLKIFGDDQEHTIRELVSTLSKHFALSEQELNEMIPSGKQSLFYNRVGWARTYLSKSGLLRNTRRSFYKITDRGKEVLSEDPPRIDMKYLEKYPEYLEFRKRRKKKDEIAIPIEKDEEGTPEEALESAYQEIQEALAQDLLDQVVNSSSIFFERLVIELLVKMGYGGSRRDAARAVGKTGDEGIDGIIYEDRLGLDVIYIQAKKWESGNTVGRPEIQKFVGALMGKRARKGIFITTSSFSNEAIQYVSQIDYKIVLIDGKRLAEFMIDNDVGVSFVTNYQVKRIDSDYFAEG